MVCKTEPRIIIEEFGINYFIGDEKQMAKSLNDDRSPIAVAIWVTQKFRFYKSGEYHSVRNHVAIFTDLRF